MEHGNLALALDDEDFYREEFRLLNNPNARKSKYIVPQLSLVDNQAAEFQFLNSMYMPNREYKIIFEKITPHGADLDQITGHLLKSLNQAGLINDHDYRAISEKSEKEVHEPKDPVYASHPVYRAKIIATDELGNETLADVVFKLGDNPNEAKAYKFFSQFSDIRSPDLVFNNQVMVDGKLQNVIATKYIEGENLTELCQRQDENLMKYSWDAVGQLARIQVRGRELDLEDVVAADENYFSGRIENTFIKKFKDVGHKAGWLTDADVKEIDGLQSVILRNYGAVNKRLAKDSLENGVMYADFSPMNIRVSGEDTYAIDLAGGRKLTGMLSFVSMTEFGKKYLSDNDLEAGRTEYYTQAQKDTLFYRWLSERKFEETGQWGLSREELRQATKLRKYAALHRHLEYTGYASRDMSEADDLGVLRNEFNRQRYHMRMAMKYVKDILNTDADLTGTERLQMLELSYALKRMNNIVERQAVKSNAIYS